MEMTNFSRDFVERTLENLSKSETSINHSFTNLINNSLGLLVLPFEYSQRQSDLFLSMDVSILKNKDNMFNLKIFKPIRGKDKNNVILYYEKTIFNLLRKVRNGIVHRNIAPINDGKILKSIIITNTRFQIKDLEIEFSENQLREFCIYVADSYLRNLPDNELA